MMTRQRGSILLYVVWIVMLLSVFAGVVGARALSTLNLSERLPEQLRAAYIARGAVAYAADVIASDETPSVDGLDEGWTDSPSQFQQQPFAGGSFTIMSAAPSELPERYGLADEERRINLNTAPGDVLQELLQVVGGLRPRQAAEVAAAIEDWRDEDSDERDGGAESYTYRSLRDAYDCKDGPFENVEELLLVKGMSPDVYRAIEPYVTVYGSGRINLNTAEENVLRTFGLSETGLQGLLTYRAGEDGRVGTADDRRLISVAALASELQAHLPVEDLARLQKLAAANLFSVSSEAFRLRVEATTPYPSSLVRVVCVLDRSGTVQLWSER